MTAIAPPLLAIERLSKTFPGLQALRDVGLEVRSGEILALVGQNGSGKSTLVKILAGVQDADPGASVLLAVGLSKDQRTARRSAAVARVLRRREPRP